VTAIAPQRFRHVLGHLPTGVVVVTARLGREPAGMTLNSVTSVSLDPPLILICPAKSSTSWPAIRAAGRFCVNVMADHQAAACGQFARRDSDRFAGIAYHDRAGVPAIDEAVAWIDASIRIEHDAGDHTIVVADVIAIEAAEHRDPLVFFRGRYGTFAAADA
jgi:3-hydroxy-9,10-secoandrosta-1,3,5(10)-triene-9,17-dione monooxygenase reductase component